MSSLSSHVLDNTLGIPGRNITVELSLLRTGSEDAWKLLGSGITNDDGRISSFVKPDITLARGTYRLRFHLGAYFSFHHDTAFYPWADVVFNLDESVSHYHIPLLVSPYGYSTYRGS